MSEGALERLVDDMDEFVELFDKYLKEGIRMIHEGDLSVDDLNNYCISSYLREKDLLCPYYDRQDEVYGMDKCVDCYGASFDCKDYNYFYNRYVKKKGGGEDE